MAVDGVGIRTPTLRPTETADSTAARPTTARQTGPADTFAAARVTDSGSAARQKAVDDALASIRNTPMPTAQNDDDINLTDWYDPSDIAEERAPFEDQIRALGNQSPPLSPDQIAEQSK